MSDRIEFSANTKRLVAERAGYRCSFPSCNRLTVGPGPTHEDSFVTGLAAHIYSAARRGPRGHGPLTEEQIRSAANCIWLCADHAKEIDTKRGTHFPASKLQAFKHIHEARIAREQRGALTTLGWIDQIEIAQSPVFRSGSILQLGKVTLVSGGNGSGKTALCQYLEGAFQATGLRRWLWIRPNSPDPHLAFTVRCFNPHEVSIRVEVSAPGQVQYSVDRIPVPFQPYPFKILYLPQYNLPQWPDDQVDELELISGILGVDQIVLEGLFSHVATEHGHVLALSSQTLDGSRTIRSTLRNEKLDLPFLGRSHSQQASILIELALTVARYSSKYVPTLLLLDGGMHTLDKSNLSRYAAMLATPDYDFQTLIVLTNPPTDVSGVEWSGWQMARLIGRKKDVKISQEWETDSSSD